MKSLLLFLSLVAITCAQRPADFRRRVSMTFVVPYTYSMWPVVKGGETIALHPKPFSQVKAQGEDVCFWPAWSSHPIYHRTAGRRYGRIMTQGVNCRYPDQGVLTEESYIGAPEIIKESPLAKTNGPWPHLKGASLFSLHVIPY